MFFISVSKRLGVAERGLKPAEITPEIMKRFSKIYYELENYTF